MKKRFLFIANFILNTILTVTTIATAILFIITIFNFINFDEIKQLLPLLFFITGIIGIYMFLKIKKCLLPEKIVYENINSIIKSLLSLALIQIIIVFFIHQVIITDSLEYIYIKNYARIVNVFLIYISLIYSFLGMGIRGLINENKQIQIIDNMEKV